MFALLHSGWRGERRGGGLGSMGSDNGSRRKQIHEEAVPMKVKGGERGGRRAGERAR